ncbi:MAG: site-specific DNA-methyltransferase [Candidatus Gracilibacteria bacterium]|nr:site-specific DNA-methyltransferase [Candidatus Gracilibacteria bacterium]
MNKNKLNISEEELIYLCEIIKSGEKLPAKYKELLFGKETEKKEYELKYGCKEREEDIIAETYSCPLQKVRTFEPDKIVNHEEFIRDEDTKKEFHNGWNNKLIFGDNLQVLKTLLTDTLLQKQIKENGGIKLIYIDPPFATKSDFAKGKGEKAYTDKIAGAEFIEFIRKRLILMRELLADDGFLIIHLDQKKAQYIKVVMDEIFGENNFVNEIIWSYRSGGAGKKTLPKKHDNLFVFNKDGNIKINSLKERQYLEKDFMGSSVDENGRFYVDNLLRDVFEGVININEDGKVKDYSTRPVLNVSVERIGYPTQKPEGLLAILTNIFSNEGDIVLDAFGGSGTTIAVAEKLGRKWIGIDCGKLAIYTIQNRLMNLKKEIGNKGDKLVPKPFAVYNAGLYDFKILSNLDFDTYKWFVLSLFQCKQEETIINSFTVDGKLGLNYVNVFDFNHGVEGKTLDYGYIHHLDEIIGNKIGKKFFIIVPATKVDFLETTVNYNKKEYIILRVPYSIINELHKKDFEKIIQPKSEADVNNTVEAVGFDFIRSPKVEVEYTIDDQNAYIKLITFKSKVIFNKQTDFENLETLSSIIIDYNYNGEYLHFEEVLFADIIKKNDYIITLNKSKLVTDCMIVYIDIFGNEKREKINLKTFNQK